MARYTRGEIAGLRLERMTRWLWLARAMIPVGAAALLFVDFAPIAVGAPGFVRPPVALLLRDLFGGFVFAVFALLCAAPFFFALWKGASLRRVRVGLTAVWTLWLWIPAMLLANVAPLASMAPPGGLSAYAWRCGVLPGILTFVAWFVVFRPLTQRILKGMGFFTKSKPGRVAVAKKG